jgi:N6-adenosine-specific RNA methylase IME4
MTRVNAAVRGGGWLKGRTEHFLVGVRGNPAVVGLDNGPKALPELNTFYEVVEAACPGTKAEFLARTGRDGGVTRRSSGSTTGRRRYPN